MKVKVYYNDWQTVESSQTFNILLPSPPEQNPVYVVDDNISPDFNQTLSTFKIDTSATSWIKSYDLGKLSDLEQDSFTVTFSGTSLNFLQAVFNSDDGTIKVIINEKIVKQYIGSYTLDVTVEETTKSGKTSSKTYTITFEVTGVLETKNVFNATIYYPKEPKEVKEVKEVSPPTINITSFNKFGSMEIQFSEPLMAPENITMINSTALQIKVEAANEELQHFMAFTWEAKSYSNKKLTIAITFKYPSQIAQDVYQRDKISVKVLNPTMFLSEARPIRNVKNETVITYPLPRQFEQSAQASIEKAVAQAETVKKSSSMLMGGSMVANILLAGSLSLLWGLINAMQFVTNFPLLNVAYPENAKMWYDMMSQIANFGVIPTDQLKKLLEDKIGNADQIDKDFEGKAGEVLSETTIEQGYNNSNVITGNILSLIIIGLVVVVLVILLIMRICCYRINCVKTLIQKIVRKIFWNTLIRYILEASLQLCITHMIKLYVLGTNNWFESFSSVYSIATLCTVGLLAFLAPVFLTCKKKDLKEPDFIAKYGSLTMDLRVQNVSIRFFNTLFLLRRVLLSALIVYCKFYPCAQIQLICLACTFQVIYIGYFQPYIERWQNWLEITNEYLVLSSTYFLFLYSDGLLNVKSKLVSEGELDVLMRDQEVYYSIGWANCAVLGIMIVLNMGVMLTIQIMQMYRKIKLMILKYKHGKHMKEFQRIKEAKKAAYALKLSENPLPLPDGSIMQSMQPSSGAIQLKIKRSSAPKKGMRKVSGQITLAGKQLGSIQEAGPDEEADHSMNIDTQHKMLQQQSRSDILESVDDYMKPIGMKLNLKKGLEARQELHERIESLKKPAGTIYRGPNGEERINVVQKTEITGRNKVTIFEPNYDVNQLDQQRNSEQPDGIVNFSYLGSNSPGLRPKNLPAAAQFSSKGLPYQDYTVVVNNQFVLPSANDRRVFQAPTQIPAKKIRKLNLEIFKESEFDQPQTNDQMKIWIERLQKEAEAEKAALHDPVLLL